MLKIGLTGGIGSGKTAVAGMFHVLGIPIFYADQEARTIMEKDMALIEGIKALFGGEAYQGKQLNRKYIADIVFTDPAKLTRLNALVHPAAISAANSWMNNQTTPYVIKEAALLFEAGSAAGLDYVIGVSAPEEVRINRVMLRDTLSRDEVLARMSRQMDEEEKMKLCDFVLINDGQQLLIPQVLKLHNRFLEQARSSLPVQ